MGPANALEASGFILLSGDEELTRRVEPDLAKMTGKILHFGAEAGKAAAMKLTGNAFLVCFTASLRETLGVAKTLDVSVSDLFTLFASWNPGAQLHQRLTRMTSADLTKPSWELAMARKDTGLFIQAAQQTNTELLLLPAIASLMDQWIRKGYGNHDWTIIANDVV